MYMGDDIPDIPAMKLVGLACCPQDASNEVKEVSDYISHLKGGKGAARDIIEQILKVQGLWLKGYDANYD
jgi:3-deoxy-D-manno-octulosonate 8-phosphate phosphatase (KDO 8-P phosphatase)